MNIKIKQDIPIGYNLQRLRNESGYTQEEVCTKLSLLGISISREMLSQMELGKYNIRVSILVALKEMYNATYDDIFKI